MTCGLTSITSPHPFNTRYLNAWYTAKKGIPMARRRHEENGHRIRLKGYYCVYCGEFADCDEHFPPYSATRLGFLLPCCKECNCMAGTDWPFNLFKRAAIVKDRIRAKYHRLLATPDWCADEIRPLGYNLKKGVQAWVKQKKIVQNRIAWSVEAYLPSIGNGKRFAVLTADLDTMLGSEQSCFEKQVKSWQKTLQDRPGEFD